MFYSLACIPGAVPNSAQLQLLSVDGHAKGQQDTYALNGTSCKTLGSKNLVPRCPKYPMKKEELHANRSKKVHKHTSILADCASMPINGLSSKMFGALDSF